MPRHGARIPLAVVALLAAAALVEEAYAIDKEIQYAELQKHIAKSDCWIAMDGKVTLV